MKRIIPFVILAALVLAASAPVLQKMETGLVPVSIRLNTSGEAGEGEARTLMPAGTEAAGCMSLEPLPCQAARG